MVPRVRFFFSGDATIFTPAAVMAPSRANVARRLALHYIVRVVRVQAKTRFCTLSGSNIVDLN
jgi:hypothetical protein